MIDATKKASSPEETQRQIESINKWIKGEKENPTLVDHFHDGFDTSKVSYENVVDKKIYVHHTVQGTGAATAANYGVFYIVPVACTISVVQEVHQTAGTNGGAVTVGLEKLTGTTAAGSGDDVLENELSLKSTINTTQTGTLSSTFINRSLVAGDRLALKDTGTLTDVAGVTVMVELIVL